MKKFVHLLTKIKLVLFVVVLLIIACVIGYKWKSGDVLPDNDLLIIPIAGADAKVNRRGDVVFIHGLDGHFHDTWVSEREPNFDFPLELSKKEEFKDVGFWTVKYAASSSDWYGGSMPIEDRAVSIIEVMNSRTKRIGTRPLIFVTHSLGGLVAKQIIVTSSAANHKEYEHIPMNTKGVVFLATPHAGADIATYLVRLAKFLPGMKAYRVSPQSEQLVSNSSMLANLGIFYKGIADKHRIATRAFFENGKSGKFVTVVDRASADPGITGVICTPVDANHGTICKPNSSEHPVFLGVADFIAEKLVPNAQPDNTRVEEFFVLYDEAKAAGPTALKALKDQYAGTTDKAPKQVTWKVFVKSVNPADGDQRPYLFVLASANSTQNIFAKFWPEKFPTHVVAGKTISIKGRITDVDTSGVAIDDCELVQLFN